MAEQNYSNHSRYVPGYHYLLSTLLITGLIISIINVVRHPANGGGHVSSALIALLFVCAIFSFWYGRQFPIKAQDRAIRAEESLRFFILTGKPLDSRLTIGQTIALRFASDDEFVALAAKAVAENLSPNDIKKSIKNWRPDNHRV
ncbi:MAG: DUF6526 family protein [Bacteroidia bacterium]